MTCGGAAPAPMRARRPSGSRVIVQDEAAPKYNYFTAEDAEDAENTLLEEPPKMPPSASSASSAVRYVPWGVIGGRA